MVKRVLNLRGIELRTERICTTLLIDIMHISFAYIFQLMNSYIIYTHVHMEFTLI